MLRMMLLVIALIMPLFSEESPIQESASVESVSQETTYEESTTPEKTPEKEASADESIKNIVEHVVAEDALLEEIASDSFDLEAHITKIKACEGDERRVLMNQLKLQLRAMNKENRNSTLKALGQGQQQVQQGNGQQRQQGMQQQIQQQRGNGQQVQRGRP